MDKATSLIAILMWLPVIAAVLCYIVHSYAFRNILVWLTGITLATVSVMLFATGPFDYQPSVIWNGMVEAADFVLMVLILYLGIKNRHKLIINLTLIQIAVLIYFDFFMGPHTAVNPIFVIDNLALVMSLIINIVGSLICIYGVRYIAEHEEHHPVNKTRQPRFMFWLVIFLGAMNGIVFSNDLMWLYFFWEMTTLCSYELIGHNLDKEAIDNACRALWMNMAGGVAFALALVLLALSMPGQPLALRTLLASPGGATGTILLAVALLVLAGFTKSAQMPFQNWLLGAMVAPTPVSALLHSSTMVKAGVYLIVRMAPAYQGTYISNLVAVAGAFTFMMTSILAVTQSNAKRVLAYSTIANLGLIIACAGINTPVAISAAIALIIFHAVSKGLLFLSTGVIEHNIGSRDIEDMGGLVDRMPVTTMIVAIGVLSMFLPPFGMLMGKWAAIEASTQLPLVALMFVAASAVTALFWIKWLGRLLEGEPGLAHKKPEHLAPHYWVSLGGLALGAVIMGVMVLPIMNKVVIPAVKASHQNAGLIVQGASIAAETSRTIIGSLAAVCGTGGSDTGLLAII
jgi:ech hydrogenase subunit A